MTAPSPHSPETPDAIVIGAGPAGLACAACLKQAGLVPLMLEKDKGVGPVWRRHYERLHLHTYRGHSGLPGFPMPREYPRYPSRVQVVEYLEAYARHFDLEPKFGTEALRATRAEGLWRVETGGQTYAAPNLVVATGFAGAPYCPTWPGEDGFGGEILHSSEYRNAQPFEGRRVLVVGFGNSGGEIALDLAEGGVDVAIGVRGPVNIVPREVLGIPVLTFSIALRPLPTALADRLGAPFRRLRIGSLERLGLRQASKGPLAGIRERRRVPLIDIGTVAKIREGAIAVRPGVRGFEAGTVVFADDSREPYDAVILATGFRPDLRALLPEAGAALDDEGMPVASGRRVAPGLYFCGFYISPTGQLREIGLEARAIARQMAHASEPAD